MPGINFTSSTFDKKPANTVVVLSPNIIKQGDQKHDLRIQLLRGETPVDLTGKTVLWSAASTKGKFITDREAEVSTNGEVSLSLVDEDAGAFGELRVEIKVIHEDGKVEKFPANDFARFTITYSLDDITNTPVYFASVAFFEQKVNQAENAAETAKQAAMSAEQRAVYVERQGDIAESQGLFAQAKATEARDQAALAKQVAEENKTNWKQEVATVVLRNSTYPNPQIGDTVRITGEARIDRFNGTEWVTTDRYNPAVVDNLTVKLAEEAQKLEALNLDKASKSEVQNLVVNKAEKNYVDSQLETKAGKSEVFSMANMGQDVKESMTGGSVAVVGKNTVLKENIVDKQITDQKLNFLTVVSDNLINKSDITHGGFFNGTGVWSANSAYKTSGFIPVIEGQAYKKKDSLGTTFWDANYMFKGYITGTTVTPPAGQGIKYARVTFNSSENLPQFNTGDTVKQYDDYKVTGDILLMKTENLSEDISFPPKSLMGVVSVPTENLFDKSKAIYGYYDGTGNFVTSNTYMISDFIEVSEGSSYVQKTVGYRSYWDVNKQYVRSTSGEGTITVPMGLGIKYIRVITTPGSLESEMFVKGTSYPPAYIPFSKYSFDPKVFKVEATTTKKSKIDGLKWVAGGDSITAWNPSLNYVAQINASHGTNGINYGLGGRAIASRGSTIDATYKPMVQEYLNFPADADIVSIFCGTNDFDSQVPLGNIDSTSPTEFFGALNILATGLIERHLGKKIAFLTPMQRRDSENTIPLTAYVQAVKDIGFNYGIPVFDMFNNCGLYPKNDLVNAKYFTNSSGTPDGLHPNPDGHKVFAPRIASFLESL